MSMVQTLTPEEVLSIHEALVAHFAREGDPIDPPGVRSIALLQSAVSRQLTSIGEIYKYPEPRKNAATLMYGICMDHPFHNGNKRTAFVSALIHLDRNGYVPTDVTHTDLYNMLLALADHRLTSAASAPRGGKGTRHSGRPRLNMTPDQEVEIVGEWLKRRTRLEDKREHPLTFRQLRRILSQFNCRFGAPRNNFVDVFMDEEYEESGFLGLGKPTKKTRQAKATQVSYSGEGELVHVSTIKMIRKYCQLLPMNGVDSRVFYDQEAKIDYFVNQYRLLLTRLAKA